VPQNVTLSLVETQGIEPWSCS